MVAVGGAAAIAARRRAATAGAQIEVPEGTVPSASPETDTQEH